MLPPFIGFAGYKRSGKNTAAEVLTTMGYTLEAFANPVREAALILNPYFWSPWDTIYIRLTDLIEWYGDDKVKELKEVRLFYQRIGTEVGRNMFGEDCWVDHLARRTIGNSFTPMYGGKYAVTDVRFTNEVDFIQRRFLIDDKVYRSGLLIWIDNPNIESTDTHASESGEARELADVILVNDGTVEELHTKVLKAIRYLTN